MIPDETRYGEIPREMRQAGEWVVPRVDGLRYFEKPILAYWLTAAAIRLEGETPFSVRLPAFISAWLTAGLLFLLLRTFAGLSVAFIVVPVYLSSLGVFLLGEFALLDGPFSLFVAGAVIIFYLALQRDKPSRRGLLLFLAGILSGLAFLTKGLLGFAIPFLAVFAFLLWEGRILEILPWALIPLGSAFLTILPWSVMISEREPDFWSYFIRVEHFRRFFAHNAQHHQPFWFFLPVLLVALLPWTFLFPGILRRLIQRGGRDPLVRLALCWFFPPFLLLSASHGKLATYALPLLAPLSLLITLAMAGQVESNGEVASRMIDRATTVMIVFFTFLGIFTTILRPQWLEKNMPEPFLLNHAVKIDDQTILVSDRKLTPALCWYSKRRDVFLLDNAGEFDYGCQYPDSKDRCWSIGDLSRRLREGRDGSSLLLVVEEGLFNRCRRSLPTPQEIDHGPGIVMAWFQFSGEMTVSTSFEGR